MRPTHPLHAPFVHFPIALLGTSLLFDLAGMVRGEPLWWAISYWNIALGLGISVITATTGLVDSSRIPSESPAAGLVNRHLLVVGGALGFYGGALAVRSGAAPPQGMALYATLALELVGLGLLLLGGWLGGEMVYRHGVGRVPEPDPAPDRA